MITPLSNCDLFIDEPGLVSPCVTVRKQSSSTYALPLVNNTGSVYKYNNIEHNTSHNIEDSSPYNIGLSTNTQECQSLINLIDKHSHLFVSYVRQLTQTNVLQATFNTGNSQPIKQRPYKNPLALEAKLDEQINDMLEAGIVSPSCN